ncbi:MAG: BON domain-containing protein [Candidatus Nucleicultricaceae bacterium]
MSVILMNGCGSSHFFEGTQGSVDDETLAHTVRLILNTDQNLADSKITVTSENGIIKLSGAVNSALKASYAEQRAAEISGVRDVKNKLKVEPSS